ncbi:MULTISPECIES: 3-hydroxyacyl-ACP dehydratase FabZ [unclassified Neochlamydia]|uniref:3-hydroxyacyl-ACP dehydratase FabZ n=1 Tax=unclassified Neochlamydia TaxID=2643326 RepID=UPI00140E19EC|nr:MULTISPECIES: 3-hydroxyacyl-ACP dehydratase FabZ [unclassified Neochlamydia]MBS4167371.1 3-hydroxyacyl-[acyl-carrier-protein] dehydratase FabZ [Neochlamydia sp. AcF65]MBS4169638.1 3-hydroxyacyl-[acyl-carrier-protein] dehydratase FabZ [Neochlamydia sp. AcF95]NGY95454.1 3-hydroxyacyl-[acyl-carrier-protein] dehydratase FabZ [Neochlamydia sp. AcF84]
MEVHVADYPKSLDIKQIAEILPHRFPFLLVDRVLDINIEQGLIVGQKNLTFNEAFFQGHFPDTPIMPGVLMIEALAQLGGILIHMKGYHDKIAVLLTVNNAKFRNPAKPGDVLILKVEGIHLSSKAGRMQATATVNDKITAEAEIGFALVDKSQL